MPEHQVTVYHPDGTIQQRAADSFKKRRPRHRKRPRRVSETVAACSHCKPRIHGWQHAPDCPCDTGVPIHPPRRLL
jgi:hypothetical protein